MKYALALIPLLFCAACGDSEPKTVELTRTFHMMDEEGKHAGTVIFRPLGTGEVRDASNRVIGVIVAPAQQ